MIKIIEGNLFDSKANFIVHNVNCEGIANSKVFDNFHDAEREYLKYLRYCKKNNIDPLGTAQFVPSESWALTMVDTMKNNNVIDFDTNYQYIVNLFVQRSIGVQTDIKAMKKGFVDIKEKANKIGATVAIGSIGSCNSVYNVIKEVFENSGVDVEIYNME